MSTTLSLVSELERIASAVSEDDGKASQVSLASVAEKIAKSIGIPLSSTSALAVKTVRDSRPEIDNNFAAVRHASVFEGVKIDGESRDSIQKIISAPILLDGKVIGVIQISRKGPDAISVGSDFTADDLGKILALCKPLGKLLQRAASE